jgi:hypothetical protein
MLHWHLPLSNSNCQSHLLVPPELMDMKVLVKGLLRVWVTGFPVWVKGLADR